MGGESPLNRRLMFLQTLGSQQPTLVPILWLACLGQDPVSHAMHPVLRLQSLLYRHQRIRCHHSSHRFFP